jgi:nucleoside 2-deoxyribosyltransferase
MKQIYLAYSMTNSSQYLAGISALADSLKSIGYKVTRPGYELFPEFVVERTLCNISNADVVIADLSLSSHGVGFELGFAYSMNKKVILISEAANREGISKFVSAVFGEVFFYENSEELINYILGILNKTAGLPAKKTKILASAE